MNGEIIPTTGNQIDSIDAARLAAAGQVANQYAAAGAFADYISRKAENTLKRQARGLALFARFLVDARALPENTDPDAHGQLLQTTGAAWAGVTWGLVESFVRWQLQQGYAVSSVNVRLSTVKAYAKLAFKAGALNKTEYLLIKGVSGYSHKESKRIDEKRSQTRVDGAKKDGAVLISDEQAKALKSQPHTPQGRRDNLLMALLLDHGLRVSEVVDLTARNFDLDAAVLTFYRAKTDTTARHDLSAATVKALRAYIDAGDAPVLNDLPILRGSRKGGALTEAGMNRFAITRRVGVLAADLEIDGLSAHDCRHYAATKYAQKPGVTTRDLMDFFGWSSPAMAARYQHAAEVSDLAVR